MNTFTNKVAVITGGNSGIGLATAKELSRRGAKVVISGRDEKTLAEAAAAIGGDTLAVRADVSRLGDLDELFARTRKRFGSIDMLFLNAGMGKFAPVEQTTEALYDEIMDINFKGRSSRSRRRCRCSRTAGLSSSTRRSWGGRESRPGACIRRARRRCGH
jgi:NAD(P)-dependent dehydrogenase (short-subunit alcohol dehydrogenase family)